MQYSALNQSIRQPLNVTTPNTSSSFQQQQQKSNSNTNSNDVWSKFGVDISLDNLTPYSKGIKSQPINNVPMNQLMQQQQQQQQQANTRMITPPMSPSALQSQQLNNNFSTMRK